MPQAKPPAPSITLTQTHARRFLLAHHRLWPPRQLEGKPGIMEFIRHVGCIQFDPLNVAGRNPDLVLQSRVKDYRPGLLEALLYADRQLVDGFDKVASIYPTDDWPFFARRRAHMRETHRYRTACPESVVQAVIETIRERGPLSSLDLKHDETLTGFWGREVRLGNAALEMLYAAGELVVHSRAGTRRVFELAERALPAEVLSAPDSNRTDEDYQDWHVLRRVRGLGLANPGAADCWLGIHGLDGQTRRAVLARLAERGELEAMAVEGVPNRTFYVRAADVPALEAAGAEEMPKPMAAVIAPLDNLMWDRSMLRWVFDFDYVWEVYKPKAQRQYGYYVLPVLYGERFAARFEPSFDKKTRQLTVANWWWEEGVCPDEAMESALRDCLGDFARYLDASSVQLGAAVVKEKSLEWLFTLQD